MQKLKLFTRNMLQQRLQPKKIDLMNVCIGRHTTPLRGVACLPLFT